MTTIQALLNEFGQPPPRVAMDWACQIRSARTHAHAQITTGEDATWTNLDVGHDGLLELNDLTPDMAQQALIALGEWSNETLRPSFGVDTHETSAPRQLRRPPSPRTTTRRRSLTVRAAASVCLLVLGALFFSYLRDAPNVTADQGLNTLSQPPPGHTPATFDEAITIESDARASSNGLALEQSTDPVADALAHIDTELGVLPRQDALNSLPLSASLQPPDAIANATSAPTKSDTISPGVEVVPTVDGNASASSVTNTGSPSALPDVMKQVNAALEEAASQPSFNAASNSQANNSQTNNQASNGAGHTPASRSEGSVANHTDANPDVLRQPAIMLTREMTHHHHELPKSWLRRPREPYWSVALEASEGFVIEPATPQELPPRSQATWRVVDQQAKSPRAFVIVNVFNRGKREAALDWQVRGGAEDLPQLQLPLARRWLDPLAAQLQLSARQLRAQLENSQSNFRPAPRQFSREQRRLAHEQLLLTDRLIEIIADVDRLATLLDSEIIGSAILRSEAGGKPLLAYGELDR